MSASLTPPDTLYHSLVAAGVQAGHTVVVAFSGGLDSTALLHAAHGLQPTFGYRLQAVHIDHGLQPAASAWAAHCAGVAATRAIPFQCVRVQVATADGRGTEAAARSARYAALAKVAADWILLAHHADDQAETVLLALLRGAGPVGLAAMGDGQVPPAHPLHGRLLRPWLALPRPRLAAWASAERLHWVEDPSNQQLEPDRNFLRHAVLPVLAGRFPGWRQSLARSATWNAEAADLLAELAALDAHGWQAPLAPLADPACLPGWVAEWRQLKPARQRNLLRVLIQQRGLPPPPATRLQAWLEQLEAASDRLPTLHWQDCVLRRWAERLWLETAAVHWPPPDDADRPDPLHAPEVRTLHWDGQGEACWAAAAGGRWQLVRWPAAGSVTATAHVSSAAQVLLRQPLRVDCGPLTLRWEGGQGRLQMHAGGPHREVRKLFQEAGMPPWRRTRSPRLYAGRTLVAVPGIGTAPDWQAALPAEGWQLLHVAAE